MELIGAIVPLGVIGLAVFYFYMKIKMAKRRGNLRTILEQEWPKEFGSPVSENALNALIKSVAIIDEHVGAGKETQGRELLRKEMNNYWAAVDSEKELEFGLSMLLATSVNQNGKIAVGHKWVVEEVSQAIMFYCPNLVNKAMCDL